MRYLVAIVGESGCGKSTVIDQIIKLKLANFYRLDSYTTRPMRTRDEQGHIFVDGSNYSIKPEIVEISKDGKVGKQDIVIRKDDNSIPYIAYTYFNGYHYWAQLDQVHKEGYTLYTVDPAGLEDLKRRTKDTDIKLISIYLSLSEDERLKRMTSRGDTFSDALERINHDRQAFRLVKADATININGYTKSEVVNVVYSVIMNLAQEK